MCLDTAYIRHLWILTFVITLRSVEPYVLSECITVLNSNTDKSIFCRHGEIIQIKNATLFRSNSLTHCEELHPSNVSPYPCETMSTEVIDTIWSSCHEQNHCRYELEYPDEDDCPDYRRNRTILLVIILECVSLVQPFPMAESHVETDHDRTGIVIGAAVGGAVAGILVTIIVVAVIVFLLRKRSRAKSPQESISMETNTNALRMQPNVYAESKGFEEGNTNSG